MISLEFLQTYMHQQAIPPENIANMLKDIFGHGKYELTDLNEDERQQLGDWLAREDLNGFVRAQNTLLTKTTTLDSNTRLDQPQAIEIYNTETGRLEQRTPEQQARGRALYQRFKLVDAFKWALVKLFLDGNHHLDVGYTSKLDFYENEFGMNTSGVRKNLKAGEVLLKALPIKIDDSLQAAEQLESLSAEQTANLAALANVGTSKLYELSKADEADFSEVLATGIVRFGDGRELPLEDIQRQTRNEIYQLVNNEIESYKIRNKELLSQRQQAEAELKKTRQELADNEERYNEAKMLESTYGPKAMHLQGHYERVKAAMDAVRAANKLLTNIKLPDDAPDDLKEYAVGLHRMVEGGRQIFFNNNSDLMHGAVETWRPVEAPLEGGAYDPETGEVFEETE